MVEHASEWLAFVDEAINPRARLKLSCGHLRFL